MPDSQKLGSNSGCINLNFKKNEKTNVQKDNMKDNMVDLDENSKILQDFKTYSKLLDAKNDKYERIVKLSRDITIESKRIIFLLHTINRGKKKDPILEEAGNRLQALISNQWRTVAQELDKEDPYLYRRAFSPGMQEFIEAFTFFNYLRTSQVYDWNHYQAQLEYEVNSGPEGSGKALRVVDGGEGASEPGGATAEEREKRKILATVTPIDFFLGLADVSGELMRKCINSLGAGDVEGTFDSCRVIRELYCGFLSIDVHGMREMSQKTFTLKQNLLKTEMACYTIRVRGSEGDKLSMADIDAIKNYLHDDT